MASKEQSVPVTESNLRAFFHQSVNSAVINQQIDTGEATIWYLTNLLCDYARSEQLFDQTTDGLVLRTLTETYVMASEAPSERERQRLLRRLGDVALFISGLFSGRFTRHRMMVDVDYFMAMGGGAYAYLGDAGAASVRARSLSEIFQDLSRQFTGFVDVLAEVGGDAFGSDSDLLRVHDLWEKTNSQRLEGKLRAAGIQPVRMTWSH